MARVRSGPCWPTARQQLFLEVALLPDATAQQAWRALRPQIDLDVLEIGSFALLPLVYQRLAAWGLDDPDVDRLKGTYRRVWYGSHTAAVEAVEGMAAIEAAGLEVMGWDALALAHCHYPDPGLRRTEYVELLVRRGCVAGAATALVEAGFEAWETPGDDGTRLPLTGPRGGVCVVSVLPPLELALPNRVPESADFLWEHARRATIAEREVLVPAPEDELLLALVAGARPSVPARRVQWVADGAMLLRRSELDWDRIVREAHARRAVLRLRETLAHIRELGVADVPATVLADLRSRPVTRRDRAAYRLASRDPGVFGGFPQTLAAHLRLTGDDRALEALRRLPAFLRSTWGIESALGLPVALLRKTVGALVAALRPARSA